MADETAAGASTANAQTAPSFNLIGQYIRDMSFENPGAPGSIMLGGPNPTFNVGINVGVKKQADDVYAVEITLNAKAEREKNVLFNVELIYGGVFRMKNIPENQLAPLLLVECPRLIFPFARQVLASVTQQGGFPPLMMEPVDFNAIYLQNLRQLQASQGGTSGSAAPTPQVN
jgi:preprotein translocase subunit SecB